MMSMDIYGDGLELDIIKQSRSCRMNMKLESMQISPATCLFVEQGKD